MSSFLTERKERLTPDEANALNIKRIEKIDFSGQIHLADNKPTKTGMIIIKKGDLVISGINVAKGALAVYDGDEDVIATIHYSAYSFDTGKLDIEFLKWFVKSPAFVKALQEQTSGGIKTEIKAKKFLALKIPMPPLNDQQLIASRLNEFEQKYKKIQSELQTQSDLIAKLRSSILSDAVSGRLVPQDPTDEPVSVLLERIKAEKERLVKEGKIKKQKPLPPISDDAIPYELPDGWVWCRLKELIEPYREITYGVVQPTKMEPEDGVFMLRCSDVKPGKLFLSNVRKIPKKVSEKYSRTLLKGGEVLINIRGTLGGCAIASEEVGGFNIAREIAMIPVSNELFSKYILYVLLSPLVLGQTQNNLKGIAYKGLNLKDLEHFLISLPPLVEQHRIVAKVEKLMATCDQLEAEVQKSRTETNRLMQTVLKEAFSAR